MGENGEKVQLAATFLKKYQITEKKWPTKYIPFLPLFAGSRKSQFNMYWLVRQSLWYFKTVVLSSRRSGHVMSYHWTVEPAEHLSGKKGGWGWGGEGRGAAATARQERQSVSPTLLLDSMMYSPIADP